MKQNNLKLDVHDKPVPRLWIILSLQHVFAMFGSTVLVPILLGLPVSVALFTSGFGTLVYILCTKKKSPVYLGSSFAYIQPLLAVMAYNTQNASINYSISVMAVGLIYVFISFIFRFFGTDWFYKILPPVIIGPIIMIIGLSLASYAVTKLGLISQNDLPRDFRQLVCGFITIITTIAVIIYGKGTLKLIPVLVGIFVGYCVGLILGLINLTPILEAPLFSLPEFRFLWNNLQTGKIDWNVLFIVLPVTLVTLSEHIGDHIVLGTIIHKNLLKEPGLARTLLGDGLATTFAGIVGGPVNTTYAENTGVISLTKIASVYVIGGAAIGAMGLAFIGKMSAFIQTIPDGVIGGISVILFGMIALNGIRVLLENKIDLKAERNTLIIGTILVIGLGAASGIKFQIGSTPFILSGVVVAAVLGILLHLFLPNKELAYGERNLEHN